MKYSDEIQYLGEKFQKTKDNKYFTDFYNLSFPYYRGTCYRYYLNDKHKIEDILNSFYRDVYQFIDSYDIKKGRFTHWIGTIFTNEVISSFKMDKRHLYFENIFNKFEYLEEESEFDFLREEKVYIRNYNLNHSLLKVMEPFQTVLKEKYYNNMTLKEIAEKYNVSCQIVKNQLLKGRYILREIIKNPNFKLRNPISKNNVLKLAIKEYNMKRYNMLNDLSKEDLIKIVIELEEQIKVLNN